jgi:rhodanese-related sulfurtransferase
MPVADWLGLDRTDALPIDRREPDEFASGHIPNEINLPPSQMRPLRRAADDSGALDLLGGGTAGVLRHPVPDAARISIADSVGKVYDVSGIQCRRPKTLKVGLEPASHHDAQHDDQDAPPRTATQALQEPLKIHQVALQLESGDPPSDGRC